MRTMTTAPELIAELQRRLAATEETVRCLEGRLTLLEDAVRELVYLLGKSDGGEP